MEPDSSPPRDMPENNPEPSLTPKPQHWVKGFKSIAMDRDLGERFMSKVHETASSVLEFALQWEEYDKEMDLNEVYVRKQILELKKKEERLRVVEERERKIELIERSIVERLTALEEKEKESDLKQLLEASVMMLVHEMQNEEVVTQLNEQEKLLQVSIIKKGEELMGELEARKNELSLLNETIKEKSTELEKKEDNFQLKQKAEATEIGMKSKFLELKEKKLEEREEELALKQRELQEEESIQAETRKRSRLEFGPSLLAEKGTDADSLIRPEKKHKSMREFYEAYMETDSACELHGKTSSHPASEHSSEAKRREVDEIVSIDEFDEDTKPFSYPGPDFNDFNNTMSSFAVGQVWALYDPLDDMPRYYAQIRRILRPQLSVRVTWLESVQTAENEKPIPIACGRFKYGDSDTQSLLAFSHQMDAIIRGKYVTINPRKGETWALFRDWTKSWNSHSKQHKPSDGYDFVEVLSELDRDQGIGVAYLGRVEGFTSVYKPAEQHGLVKVMIASDEMLRFSHRVPSFNLTGDEKEGIPAGSFELDPAAIPQALLKSSQD